MKKSVLILNLVLILFLSFCATKKQPKKDIIIIPPGLEEAQKYSAHGDFPEAMEAYHEAFHQNPGNDAVKNEYIQTLERINLLAGKDFEQGNYLAANNRYYLLSKNFSKFESFRESLSFDLKSIQVKMRECIAASAEAQAEKAFRDRDYSQAVKAYKDALEAYPGDDYLSESLSRTVKRIFDLSKKAMLQSDYLTAGKLSFLILEECAEEDEIESILQNCSSQLKKRGLDLYRKGKLKQAIAVWKGILEFDPKNAEIKKAVANAEEQLSRIKK